MYADLFIRSNVCSSFFISLTHFWGAGLFYVYRYPSILTTLNILWPVNRILLLTYTFFTIFRGSVINEEDGKYFWGRSFMMLMHQNNFHKNTTIVTGIWKELAWKHHGFECSWVISRHIPNSKLKSNPLEIFVLLYLDVCYIVHVNTQTCCTVFSSTSLIKRHLSFLKYSERKHELSYWHCTRCMIECGNKFRKKS